MGAKVAKERQGMHIQTAGTATIDLAAIKGRRQIAWGSSDYARLERGRHACSDGIECWLQKYAPPK